MDQAGDSKPMTASAVGRMLGMHRSRVLEIPREHLPYTTTQGGAERAGRRYYDPAHVRAYLAWRSGQGPSIPELARTVEEQGRQIEDLRRRVDELEVLDDRGGD